MNGKFLVGILKILPGATDVRTTLFLIEHVVNLYFLILTRFPDELYLFSDQIIENIVSRFDRDFQNHYYFYTVYCCLNENPPDLQEINSIIKMYEFLPSHPHPYYLNRHANVQDLKPSRMRFIGFLITKMNLIRKQIQSEIRSILSTHVNVSVPSEYVMNLDYLLNISQSTLINMKNQTLRFN